MSGYIGLRMLKDNWILNLLAISFLVCLCLGIVIFGSVISVNREQLKLAKPFGREAGVYILMSNNNGFKDINELCDSVPHGKEKLYSAQIDTYDLMTQQDVKCVLYNTALANKLEYDLIDGEWKPFSRGDENFAVVSANTNRKTGDKMSLKLSDKADDVITVTVSGILPNNASYIRFSGYTTSSLACVVDNNKDDKAFVLLSNDNLLNRFMPNINSAVVLIDDAYPRNLTDVVATMRQYGECEAVSSMIEGTKTEIDSFGSVFIPLFISFALLAILFFAVVIIATFDKSNIFTIVYFCGATRKQIFCAAVLYFLFIYICTLIFSVVGYVAVYGAITELQLFPQTALICIMFSILFVLFTVSGIVFAEKISNTKIVDRMKDSFKE